MVNKKYFQDKKSRIVFGIFAGVIFGLVLFVAKPYINTIILAIIVSYILQPIYKFLTKKLKTKKISASILSTALTVLFTLVIGLLLVVAIVNIASIVLEQANNLKVDNTTMQGLKDALTWFNNRMQLLNIPAEITLQEIVTNLKDSISTIANNALSAATSISSFSVDALFKLTIFYGLTYTIIPHFDKVINFIKNIVPFDKEITALYIDRTLKTAKAMVWGMLIVALGQSLIAGIILYILGTPYLFIVMILLVLFSFIPLLGTGMITLPIAAMFMIGGNLWKGIVLALFQIIVIGNIDGILRAKLIPKDVRMPIFVSFIAIFGGLSLWGIWGLIYGPVGFILLMTTIEVIQKYYIPSIKKD